ncbi:MBL fold metallo-hydrolase [Pseudoalteromonas sp. SSDWG2]|uniref:MBL fold metallo-hydrolase n=1 Tax=Pseudoalteromonas sp. SSDWG2 TaxID=3139391 RepID=UPI003BAB4EF9
MQIQVLGSSSGTPTRDRNVSAYAVFREDQKPWYLVDCGEGTQHQILKSALSLYQLEAIFITHKHGDHCYGLPGLIASAGLSGRTEPLFLIAPKEVLEFIDSVMQMTDLALPFELTFMPIESYSSNAFSWLKVQTCALKHRVPSYAFKFTETRIQRKLNIEKLSADGVGSGPHYNRLQRGENVTFEGRDLRSDDYTFLAWQPRVMVICGDNEAPKCLDSIIEGVHLLVHEATFLAADLRKVGFHTGHSDVERISEYAQKKRVPYLLLTHFSARYGGQVCMDKIQDVAQQRYTGRLFLAADGMTIAMDKTAHCALVRSCF